MSTKTQTFEVSEEMAKEIKPQQRDKDKSSIKSIIKNVLNLAAPDNSQLIDAEDAYLRVTYREYTTKKKIFHDLVASIKDKIRSRVEQNSIYTFFHIQPEMMDYAEEIAKTLREYGYQVWVIDKEVLNTLQPETPVNKTTMFMLIMWDKVY